MSVDRSVRLYCDKPAPICRATFSYGTTSLRVTRTAATGEGWYTSLDKDGPDYCPEHKGQV
ncbi:hypothetical protein QEH42_gp310 [Microbacterium phage Pumpernickel]|uniref:Uncharacterized protein n=1 Tax=Microbacterium phage Pumpernickel TaxID=2885983 RepID=A0AAE8Y7K4_9CAUD|nr:hypothetical protein QEH42_gp310 [Microbacterium phage Pumpernickel]UDL15908.1 hypothetical protein SEA_PUMPERNICKEL_130 [Microbacterium phage Pumpernickel]